MSKKCKCAIILVILVIIGLFSGCSPADTVNNNISKAANNFEVERRVTVYNARTDLVIMQIEGFIDISNNSSDELVVTCQVGPGMYKKNYVYLNDYTLYVVEDITGTHVDPYHYEVHFYTTLPKFEID